MIVHICCFCSVRVANELGRGSSKAAKFSILITVLTSLSIGLVLFLLFLLLREKLAYIFTTEPEVVKAVGDLSPLLSFSILLNSVQPVLSGIIYFIFYLLLLCVLKIKMIHFLYFNFLKGGLDTCICQYTFRKSMYI